MDLLVHNDTPSTNYKALRVFLGVMIFIWLIAGGVLVGGGDPLLALFLVYVGLFVGVGVGLFLSLQDRKRNHARRIMMVMIGGLLLWVAFASDHGNMQIEGLFFGIVAGAAPWAVLHFALAKIIGPLAVGRIWCGWACWYAMIFDLLPYPYSRYRIPGKWGWLRYGHFAISLLIVIALVIGGYHEGGDGIHGMAWFAIGLAGYYVVGIALALALKDNRAFCKYVCPIAVPLKLAARYSLLRIAGTPDQCGDCEACVEMCPMNIRVRDYIIQGQRVLSTECTLCQTCIYVCPHNSLSLSIGRDVGNVEYTDWEPPKRRR